MQHIYMQSDEHFQVFTTVLTPQARRRRRRHQYTCEELDKVVVAHSYVPQWPDEVELAHGDAVQVLSKQDESRGFGQLQNGQQGYFPASCVIELSHNTHRDGATKNGEGLRRRSSIQVESVVILRERAGAGRQQAPRGGGKEEGPFLTLKHDAQAPSSAHSSPSLLHRILSKHGRKSQCQGAGNGATERD